MDVAYRFANTVGRLALRVVAVQLHWAGVERLPLSGPVILASNHVSYPDFVFLQRMALSRGRYVRFMTRHDVWQVPLVSWFMTRMQHIPVDRQAPAAAYLHARRLLRAGEAVGVFPEAGISYSFTVRALMKGAAALARETGAPIVPVAIWGSQRIWSVGNPVEPPPDRTRGRRVDVSLGEAVYVDSDADLTEVTRILGHRLTELLEELQLRPEHQPRPGEIATWHPAHLGGRAPTRSQAHELDIVPNHAVRPTWGPGLDR